MCQYHVTDGAEVMGILLILRGLSGTLTVCVCVFLLLYPCEDRVKFYTLVWVVLLIMYVADEHGGKAVWIDTEVEIWFM